MLSVSLDFRGMSPWSQSQQMDRSIAEWYCTCMACGGPEFRSPACKGKIRIETLERASRAVSLDC